MTEDFKYQIIDRLFGWELVELLDISIEDVIEAFAETIEDNQDIVEEFLLHGR